MNTKTDKDANIRKEDYSVVCSTRNAFRIKDVSLFRLKVSYKRRQEAKRFSNATAINNESNKIKKETETNREETLSVKVSLHDTLVLNLKYKISSN